VGRGGSMTPDQPNSRCQDVTFVSTVHSKVLELICILSGKFTEMEF
jgi:hypothetical protein